MVQLNHEEAKRLGLIKKSKSPHRDEIDSLSYSILGVLAKGSCKTVRTQALKKACKLHGIGGNRK